MAAQLSRLLCLAFALTWIMTRPATAEVLSVYRGDIDAAIRVPVGRRDFVIIPASFCEMAVADPSIADIASLSSTLAQVNGIAIGRTSLSIFDCEGGTISIVEILVVPRASAMAPSGSFYAPELRAGERIPVVKNIASITLRLPVSVSVIVETDLPSSSFEIDDKSIADAASLGNASYYILGKTVGATTMYLQHQDRSAPTVLHIEIVGNMGPDS